MLSGAGFNSKDLPICGMGGTGVAVNLGTLMMFVSDFEKINE